MKDLKGVILVLCYVLSMLLSFFIIYNVDAIGGWLTVWFAGAMVLAFLGMAISFAEIIKSSRLSTLERVMWIVMILFVFTIGELLYIIVRRKRVL